MVILVSGDVYSRARKHTADVHWVEHLFRLKIFNNVVEGGGKSVAGAT